MRKVNMLKLKLFLMWKLFNANFWKVLIVEETLAPIDGKKKTITRKDFEDLQKRIEEIEKLCKTQL